MRSSSPNPLTEYFIHYWSLVSILKYEKGFVIIIEQEIYGSQYNWADAFILLWVMMWCARTRMALILGRQPSLSLKRNYKDNCFSCFETTWWFIRLDTRVLFRSRFSALWKNFLSWTGSPTITFDTSILLWSRFSKLVPFWSSYASNLCLWHC